MGFDSCTTPIQQLHNNPSYEGGPHMWDPPSCEGLLYSCCIGVVNLTFSFFNRGLLFRRPGYDQATTADVALSMSAILVN
jgi:hypothetical protein